MAAEVWLLDDEPDVLAALASLVERAGHRVRTFSDATPLLRELERGVRPALVLLDLQLGDGPDPRLMSSLPWLSEHTPFVAVTGHASDEWLFPAIEAGCCGYLLKADAFERLGSVIAETLAGGSPMTREVSRRVLRRLRRAPPMPGNKPPSDREARVLQLLADGYTYEQIALHLDISIGSVRTYVKRVYGKLGVNTKSEATQRAMRLGYVR